MNAPTEDYDYDLAVIGAGFGGSLLAMVARRLGRSVVLLEKGRHPRFAIGESSTPLANLLLERLARRFDLSGVLPLSRYGSWQQELPHIACGLKRGFTFLHHQTGQDWPGDPDRRRQLLVAASPNDRVADTQWYRPDFDHHLVKCAQSLGANYLDHTTLSRFEPGPSGGCVEGEREGRAVRIRARLVVDASGPRGCLHHLLGLRETRFPHLPDTQALYAHFAHVKRWDGMHPVSGTPYPVDDAAVHHVFKDGWLWMLRFNNHLVSAGVALRNDAPISLRNGAQSWRRMLQGLPAVAALFEEARAVTPFVHLPRLSFRATRVHGPGWVLLPSAAGFVDPLLSTGFTLNLLGLTRLADSIENHWGGRDWDDHMEAYAASSAGELDRAALLIAALYACLNDFEIFIALTKLYLAAVSFAETQCRLREREPARAGFLLADHASFGKGFRECCERALCLVHSRSEGTEMSRPDLLDLVARTIEPVDVAGLNRTDRHNWHPVDFADLMAARHKVGATEEEIGRMLARLGLG